MYEYGTSLAVTNRLPKLTIRNNGHLLECDSFPVQKEIAFKWNKKATVDVSINQWAFYFSQN